MQDVSWSERDKFRDEESSFTCCIKDEGVFEREWSFVGSLFKFYSPVLHFAIVKMIAPWILALVTFEFVAYKTLVRIGNYLLFMDNTLSGLGNNFSPWGTQVHYHSGTMAPRHFFFPLMILFALKILQEVNF